MGDDNLDLYWKGGSMTEFHAAKFKAMVHYICYKCDKNDLGATKLNKTLWYSDLWFYVQHGRPISGETYIKHKYGPVPSRIESTLEELLRERMIEVRDAEYFGYPKREYLALKRPDLSLFNAEEVSTLDGIIESVCRGHTARSISDMSHNRAWKLADIGEELPYFTIFAGVPAPITQADLDWAHQSMAEDVPANP